MTTCPICLNPAHSWECAHASLMARVEALESDHEAHRRQMAAALRLPESSTWDDLAASTSHDEATKLRGMVRDVLAGRDRLTALLGAETERALVLEGERDEARAQLADTTRRRESVVASLTIDAPVELHTRDGVIRVRKLVHAKADPRIGDLAARVRAGDGTADDLRVLCDVAGRVALLEALVAEKDEALAKADATIARLNRGAC